MDAISQMAVGTVTKDDLFGYEISNKYTNLETSSTEVRVARGRGQRADVMFEQEFRNACRKIKRKYQHPLPLTKAKKDDLSILVSQLVPHAEQMKYWNAILNASTASRDESDDDDDNNNTADFDNDYEYC